VTRGFPRRRPSSSSPKQSRYGVTRRAPAQNASKEPYGRSDRAHNSRGRGSQAVPMR